MTKDIAGKSSRSKHDGNTDSWRNYAKTFKEKAGRGYNAIIIGDGAKLKIFPEREGPGYRPYAGGVDSAGGGGRTGADEDGSDGKGLERHHGATLPAPWPVPRDPRRQLGRARRRPPPPSLPTSPCSLHLSSSSTALDRSTERNGDRNIGPLIPPGYRVPSETKKGAEVWSPADAVTFSQNRQADAVFILVLRYITNSLLRGTQPSDGWSPKALLFLMALIIIAKNWNGVHHSHRGIRHDRHAICGNWNPSRQLG